MIALRRLPVVGAKRSADLQKQASAFTDSRELAKQLVRLAWITPYQARKLLHDRGDELRVGPYVIWDKLGEGGMGRVYRASRPGWDQEVALKVLRERLLNNQRMVRRFQREAEATRRLGHPNIVKVFDAARYAGRYYLAMEFVDGLDLNRIVRETGPLPIYLACEYARQAALGLQHAHERGLIHRDIKPANLMVAGDQTDSPFGVLKILDMGLARPLFEEGIDETGTAVTQDGTVVGTPDFMAPEQAKSSKLLDGRADLYSLGCTLHFLITGQAPFVGNTPLEKFLAHQSEPVPSIRACRPDAPHELDRVLGRLLAKSPSDRYPTAAAAAAALEPLTVPTAEAVTLPPPGRSSSSGQCFVPTDDPLPENAGPPSEAFSPFAFDSDDGSTAVGRPKTERGERIWLPLAISVAALAIAAAAFLWVGVRQGWFAGFGGPNPPDAKHSGLARPPG